jgi:diacylglycerol kinase family enzyme
MSHRPIAIVNPASGAARAAKALSRVAGQLSPGGDIEVLCTEYGGHAVEIARRVPPSCPMVIVVGGDGTINEVVTGLMEGLGRQHPLPPIGLIPVGTANVLSQELQVPRGVAAIGVILKAKRRALDLGVARLHALPAPLRAKRMSHLDSLLRERLPVPPLSEEDRRRLRPTTRYFVCMAGAGFDAEVTRAYHVMRGGKSRVHHYAVPILLALMDLKLPRMRVAVDGKALSAEASAVIVANTRAYAIQMTVAPQALPDDGLLDACAFAAHTQRDFIRLMLDVFISQHLLRKDVRHRPGRRVSLRSDSPVPVQLDGDFAGYLPLDVQVVPRAVTFFAP